MEHIFDGNYLNIEAPIQIQLKALISSHSENPNYLKKEPRVSKALIRPRMKLIRRNP